MMHPKDDIVEVSMTFYTNITSYSISSVKSAKNYYDYITYNQDEGVTITVSCYKGRPLPSLLKQLKTTIEVTENGEYKVEFLALEEYISIKLTNEADPVYTEVNLSIFSSEDLRIWANNLYKAGRVNIKFEQ